MLKFETLRASAALRSCHVFWGLAVALWVLAGSACDKARPYPPGGDPCLQCHGGVSVGGRPANAAPPRSVRGATATSDLGVGAHQQHLQDGSAIRAAIACGECHVVPTRPAGHYGKPSAAVTFGQVLGALATRGGASASWDRSTATCSNVYCHGDTLHHGGDATRPIWTTVDGTQARCGSCHGAPPPAPHVQSPDCNACHPGTVKPDGTIDVAGGLHINGRLDVAGSLSCTSCHGGAANPAPPVDTHGRTSTGQVTVGAHQRHLLGGAIRAAIACAECHLVPAQVADHDTTGALAVLTFGTLARTGGVTPAWTRASATSGSCATVYCHGATLAGGRATAPAWTTLDGSQLACDACHGAPPPSPHPFVDVSAGYGGCTLCHPGTVKTDGTIDLAGGLHVDGRLQVSAALACNTCHGNASNAAPPLDARGRTSTALATVGAHQQHLLDGALRAAIACTECHQVPGQVADHDTSGLPALLTFGTLARTGGVSPQWNAGSATCASVYCHGGTGAVSGGQATQPLWTQVDGSQIQCGSCHGAPPPSPHPFVDVSGGLGACNRCHPATVKADGSIDLAQNRHIDGAVQVVPALACNTCHGSASNAAPPLDTRGRSSTTLIGVGAHQAHLADSAIRQALLCSDCHVVPAQVGDHDTSGLPATLQFSLLATKGGVADWNRNTATCSSVYCHGDTMSGAGGTHTRPVWTGVGAGQADCGTCHGAPPPTTSHAGITQPTQCFICHPSTVTPAGLIDVAGGHHIDGQVDLAANLACNLCHAAPPATGAHLAHASPPSLGVVSYGDQSTTEQVDPAGATGRYYFGCGFCHPTDISRHNNGTVEVDLSPVTGTPGGLKSRNQAGASYAGGGGACSGVSCHSSGQATGATFVATPGWRSGATLGCGGCHGNPPTYANGGSGTATANSHIGLDVYGYEWGHVFGLPGSLHRSKHGRPSAYLDPTPPGLPAEERATPLTCQTCHYDTVDPSNTAPGGFFYLDTSVTTALAGGDLTRQATDVWKDTQCVSCHTGAASGPPVGLGRIRPLRHVNGKRDVTFDPRTALPGDYLAGFLGPDTPSRPYFWTDFDLFLCPPTNPSCVSAQKGWLPPGAVLDPAGSAPGFPATVSMDLTAARYTPGAGATAGSCSAVPCHLQQTSVAWGQKAFETDPPSCTVCHP